MASIVTVNGKQTIRHRECLIIVKQGVVRCNKCTAHRKTLHSAISRLRNQSNAELPPGAHNSTSPSSHTNLDYLNPQEVKLRVLRTLQGRLKASRQVVSRLQAKVERLAEMQGVDVESSLEEDLITLMNQHENEVTKQCDENSFQALFWRQQRQALKVAKESDGIPL